jgi:predicted O-methyltransferase YrrM
VLIVTDAVDRYLEELRHRPDPVLAEMEAHAARHGVPIVEPPTGQLLAVLAAATAATRVLEVGTAIGVSTLYLARALPAGGLLVSFEVDADRHRAAGEYLARAAVADRVDLRLEDAREGLARLEPPWDLAFIDAAKQQYGDYLELVIPLLRPGGLVVADNTLMSGAVAEGRPVGPWSEQRVREARAFNERLLSHPQLEWGTVTSIGDGVGLAVKRAAS